MTQQKSFTEQFDAFHDMAAKATGFGDFGPTDYHGPLRRLLADYDRYPRFSDVGVAMTVGDVVGKLAGRLFAEQGFKQHPEFAHHAIEKPLIIVGMPRTGTTTLHRLITQAPDTQGLELWLGAMPMPRPPRDTWEANPVYQQVAQQIEQMIAIAPQMRQIHPMSADQPDECRSALEQSFWATSLATLATVPDYRKWCLHADTRFAYRRYRRVLGLVAAGDTRRWVLKNPDHIFALDGLLDAFPDACVVQTHRDPLVALTSIASLTYQMMHLREPEHTMLEHGRDIMSWIQAIEKAEADRAKLNPARFFDVHVREFETDPVGTIERIYRHFGLPISAEARAAWQAGARRDPRGGHGAHHYAAEDFGLSRAEIREWAPRYSARLGELDASVPRG